MQLVDKIKNTFNNSSDLIIKNNNNIYIVYLESLCSQDKINEYILKVLTIKNSKKLQDNNAAPNTKLVKSYDEIINFILNGFTIIIDKQVYAVETKGDLIRSVESPTTEPDLTGPKDSFNESIQTNLGLIKRRIKSPLLINDDYFIGRYTKTKVSVLYISNIAKQDIIDNIITKIKSIDIDGITDASHLKQLISDKTNTLFPTAILTERPDKVSQDLLDGKIVILVDSSPFAIIIPAFFADFVNPAVDSYKKYTNINFIKLIRFICLICTLFLPAFYVALISYNQASIPLNLLINFAIQRQSVPFPSYIEAIFILIICAILRESDIRFPTNYGSSISIVGALVMGDAAVNAGIVSPIMIIVIAVTYITSMVFTDIEVIYSFRYVRFLSIILVCFLGLYGLYMAIFFFLIHICNLTSAGIPYTFPLAPFNKPYFNKAIFNINRKKDKYRSSYLTNKNYRKQGD